jgi:hypothetical protein
MRRRRRRSRMGTGSLIVQSPIEVSEEKEESELEEEDVFEG